MTYTPVNKETFGKWCAEYKETIRKIKEQSRSEIDYKPSGRETFEMNKKIIDLINIDVEEDDEEFKDNEGGFEEDDEDFEYDKALYVQDQDEEEVDFD